MKSMHAVFKQELGLPRHRGSARTWAQFTSASICLSALLPGSLLAADILWSSAGGAAWLTGSNWTGGAVPGAGDLAQIGANPTGSGGVGINFNNTTNAGTQSLGLRIQEVGALELTSARTSGDPVIGNSSGTAGAVGTLRLIGISVNAVPNVIIRNNSSRTLTIQNAQGSGTQTMALSIANSVDNKIVVDSSGNVVISNVIKSNSGTTPLAIQGAGAGRVDITGTANTFTGAISLLGPETRFGANGSFGDANNGIVIDGGRLATVSGSTFTLASTHGIQVSANANNSISVVTSGTLTYDGVIADKPSTTGFWAKQGAGTLALGGVSTYTGATAINNGTVQLTTGNNRLPVGTTLSLGQSASANLGTLDLNGRSQEVAGLSSNSGTNATSANNTITSVTAATLTLGGSGAYSFGNGTDANSGVIAGAITVVKSGTGSQTLGDSNTYTGPTQITGGRLYVNGSLAAGSAVTVNGGILAGNGTAAGSVSIGASGRASPGSALNFVGTLATGAMTWTQGGQYDWNLLDAVGLGGTGYDVLSLGGTLDLSAVTASNGLKLNLQTLSANGTTGNAANWVAATPKTYTVLTSTGITGFNPAFVSIDTTGFANSLGGGSFSLAQSGNNLNLIFTPAASGNAFMFDANGATAGSGAPSGAYNFSDANWSSDSAGLAATAGFVNGEIMTFSAGTDGTGSFTVNMDAAASANGITVQEGHVTLAAGSGSLTLTSGSLNVASGSSLTISEPVQGSVGLTTAGAGTVTLSGANTYTGTTTANAGKLVAGDSAAFGAAANPLAVNTGATLDLNGQSVATGSISGTGGIVTNGSAAPATLTAGDATNPGAFAASIQNGAGTVALNVQNQGATGRVTLTGVNTYTGGTTVGSGELRIAGPTSLPTSGAIAVNDGSRLTLNAAGAYGGAGQTLTLNANQSATPVLDTLSGAVVSFAGPVVLSTGATNRIEPAGSGGSLTLSGNLSGDGSLLKQAAGNLVLSGTANTASGSTQIGNGTITVNAGSKLPTGPLTFAQTATNNTLVQLNNASQSIGSLSSTWTAATGTISQNLALNNTALTINQTANGTFGQGAVSTLASTISGTGSVTKQGAASLSLTSPNTYVGNTTVAGGSLLLSGAGQLPAATALNVTAGTFDISGINAASATVGSLAGSSGGNLNLGGKRLVMGATNASTTFAGLVASSGGGLTKNGTGTLILSGANAGYTGTTVVNAGVLQLGNSTSAGTSAVTVNGDSSLFANAGVSIPNAISLVALPGLPNLIAYWNFNALSIAIENNPGAGGVPTTMAADNGSGTLSLLGAWGGKVDDFAGSTINALNADPAEESLSLIAGGSTAPFPGNGTFITLSGLNLSGYNNVQVSMAVRGTATGFSTGQWAFSTDGTTYTPYGANTATTSTTFALATPGLTSGLDNVASGFLRYTLSGATNASGNNRIDNLQVNAFTDPFLPTIGTTSGSGTATFSGDITLSGEALFTAPSGGTATFSGSILDGSNVGSITKVGAGTVTLAAFNTYTGSTTVEAGTLRTLGSGITDNSAVRLLDVAGARLVVDGDETVGSLAGGGASGGNVQLNGATLSAGGNGSSTTYSGTLSGSGRLEKTGSGTLTLDTVHTHTGGMGISGGTLRITTGNESSLGANPGAFAADSLLISNGTLLVDGASLVINDSNRGVTIGTAGISTGTFNVGGGLNLTIANALQGTNGNLRKAGAGTFNLAANAVLNGLEVQGGRYVQSAGLTTIQTTSIGLRVESGAAYELAGGELRTDKVTILAGGSLVWGSGKIGTYSSTGNAGAQDYSVFGYQAVRSGVTMQVDGSLTTAPGSVVALHNSPSVYINAGVRFNNLLVSGDLNLNGAGDTLEVQISPYLLRPFSPNLGSLVAEYGSLPLVVVDGNLSGEFDAFTGVTGDGLGFTEFTGTFTGINDLGMNQWYLQYVQDVVNPSGFAAGTYDMVFFHYRVAGYVPEPGTMGLMALGGVLLRRLRRRSGLAAA